MGKLQEMVDRLKALGVRAVGGDDEQEQVEEQEQEQAPEEGSDGDSEEVTSELDEGQSEVLEQVTLALEALHVQVADVVQAVRLIDTAVKEQDQVLRGLATNEAARLKDAMENGQWFKSLYVATRDGTELTDKQMADVPVTQQAPAQGQGGLLGPVMNKS